MGTNAGIMRQQVTIGNAALLTLPTPANFIELVPAPGIGKILVLIAAVFDFKPVAAYTGVDASFEAKIYNGDQFNPAAFSFEDNFIKSAVDVIEVANNSGYFDSYGSAASWDNVPLILAGNNVADFTGGDPGNELIVTVLYEIVTR